MTEIQIGNDVNVGKMLLHIARESPEMTLAEAMQSIQEALADEAVAIDENGY